MSGSGAKNGSSLPVIGGIFDAAGAETEANAKANAYAYNAQVADQNAVFVEQQTAEEVRRQNVTGLQVGGQQRAQYGASGVSSATGSALDVLQETARNSALDALTIKHAGDMKAWAYKSGAALDRMGAEQAQTEGQYGAAKAIIGGAAQAAAAGAF